MIWTRRWEKRKGKKKQERNNKPAVRSSRIHRINDKRKAADLNIFGAHETLKMERFVNRCSKCKDRLTIEFRIRTSVGGLQSAETFGQLGRDGGGNRARLKRCNFGGGIIRRRIILAATRSPLNYSRGGQQCSPTWHPE